MCKFCELEVEYGDHILLSYHRAWSIWCDILSDRGIIWVVPNSVKARFHWRFGRKFKRKKKLLWRAFPFAVLQTLWEMRNKLIFKGVNPIWEDVGELIRTRVVFWFLLTNYKLYSMQDRVFRFKSVIESF